MSVNSSFLPPLLPGAASQHPSCRDGHEGCGAPARQEGCLCPHSDLPGKVMPCTPAAGDSRHHQLRSEPCPPSGFSWTSMLHNLFPVPVLSHPVQDRWSQHSTYFPSKYPTQSWTQHVAPTPGVPMGHRSSATRGLDTEHP